MLKTLLITAAMIISCQAFAQSTVSEKVLALQQAQLQEAVVTSGLDWKVGDQSNYKLTLQEQYEGTMQLAVREIVPEGIWLVQDIVISIQRQKIEFLMDINTGKIIKMMVQGKEKEPPKKDLVILEQKDDSVTVPAGTFAATFVKAQDNANNNEISEEWINKTQIPITGMIMSLADKKQIGKVKLELTSFKKQ